MPESGNSFTDLELAFFRAGDEMSDDPSKVAEADDARRPTSLWARIAAAFKRS
ncbi:MAG: hypothetical protein KF773_17745 [Deltaproteobacteria bacterium]|nr:hypothetical protein [Deltaproteobacteria bacterium]MCW5803676.1 hypothetical protein [Deltaproteobacteria bacterium]